MNKLYPYYHIGLNSLIDPNQLQPLVLVNNTDLFAVVQKDPLYVAVFAAQLHHLAEQLVFVVATHRGSLLAVVVAPQELAHFKQLVFEPQLANAVGVGGEMAVELGRLVQKLGYKHAVLQVSNTDRILQVLKPFLHHHVLVDLVEVLSTARAGLADHLVVSSVLHKLEEQGLAGP